MMGKSDETGVQISLSDLKAIIAPESSGRDQGILLEEKRSCLNEVHGRDVNYA